MTPCTHDDRPCTCPTHLRCDGCGRRTDTDDLTAHVTHDWTEILLCPACEAADADAAAADDACPTCGEVHDAGEDDAQLAELVADAAREAAIAHQDTHGTRPGPQPAAPAVRPATKAA